MVATTPAKKKAGKKGDKGKGRTQKKQQVKFTLRCQKAVEGRIVDTAAMENFFLGRIKKAGKRTDLPERVTITHDQNNVHFAAQLPFSKRYVKYLTKKYLTSTKLRDFLRVVATDANSYDVRFFNIANDEGQ